ncbi:MAG: VirD4-like conjugal transfer protein, CD1115 family [Christensenellales bacterium]
MKRDSQGILFFAFLYIPVLWLSLLAAQSLSDGLPSFLENFTQAMSKPFQIAWTENSLKTLLICSAIYIGAVAVYLSSQRQTRDGEEHGSARWESPQKVNAMFAQKQNISLTRNVRLGMDSYKHQRNLNILVIGGSGASKTRGFCLPSILSANSNYVITDPKQEILNATGNLLGQEGYSIRVLNLVNLDASDGYNPFRYLRDETDVMRMVNCLIASTTPPKSYESDPFWIKSETALLQALVFYLFYEAPEYEQNFSQVCRMLEFAEARENDEDYESALDMLFHALEREQGPEHIAVKQYKVYAQAKGKTASSILVSLAVRLAPFNIPQIQRITGEDEMDLFSLGDDKAALFAVIPDNHTTFNFLVSLLYQQAFICLYHSADQIHKGRLPRHVRFILDEFASIRLEGYPRELATMRSRNISSCTVIQNMAQIKELYKDSWETIPGNSDTILYLGGNEAGTHKYLSEALGKASIQTKTHGHTHGSRGSYSTNTQITGRELLTPDEVRRLDNRMAILLIRGAGPCMDEKYPLMQHPNIHCTPMSGAPPYEHKRKIYYGRPLIAPESIEPAHINKTKEKPHENE